MTMWGSTIGCIVTLILSVLTAPLTSQAGQAAQVPRLGLLMPGSASAFASRIEAFRQGLRDLGYVEGHNITLEYRFAEGQADRLPALVAEMVRLPVDVLVVDGTAAIRSAQHATTTIPIVMAVSSDPVGAGLVASLARPGGNITGLAGLTPELCGKWLEFLKEAVPTLSRVATLWHRDAPVGPLLLKETQAAAQALGLQLQALEVGGPDEFDQAFAAMTREHADALVVIPSQGHTDGATQGIRHPQLHGASLDEQRRAGDRCQRLLVPRSRGPFGALASHCSQYGSVVSWLYAYYRPQNAPSRLGAASRCAASLTGLVS
jgi:ABC-type uncharacterized transport system substrate-binding protein